MGQILMIKMKLPFSWYTLRPSLRCLSMSEEYKIGNNHLTGLESASILEIKLEVGMSNMSIKQLLLMWINLLH